MSTMTEMTAAQWLETYGVTFDWSADGYQRSEDGWEHHAYTLTLAGDEGAPDNQNPPTVSFPWKQGMAIDDEPTADSTLWMIAGDVRAGGMDWAEFADEFGYDENDPKLSEYRSWEACRHMRAQVYAFCDTQEMFDAFMEIEEGADNES